MALIDDVKAACDRLAPLGWRDRLLAVTGNALDISQPTGAKLKAALTKVLPTIDRTLRGFEDFHATANRAVTGGSPARSLLYHALACSLVHPTADGSPSSKPSNYPTLDELEVLENFIYSLVSDRTDLGGTFVAVFAYQYREASRTTHLRHADLAYSRTGIARVGTAGPLYDPSRRGFWVVPDGGGGGDGNALPVLPARYGVFLARRAKPGTAGTVQGGHDGAADVDFVFPVHKLFAGKECLKGRTLTVAYLEFHRNEKLRKTHRLAEADGGLPVPAGFDVSKSPYVRDSSNGGNFVTLTPVGSSVLVVPRPAAALVRTVAQRNSVSGTDQVVHFIVPKTRSVRGRTTRFATSSLEIPAFDDGRLSPEYVNIRHEVKPTGPAGQTPKDLNTLGDAAFTAAMQNGGHAAAHFADDCCDGCVEAVVTGLAPTAGGGAAANIPAFSLVTAPDFFPLGDQFEVEIDPTIRRVEPLSKGRLPVNPTLPLPSNPLSFAFDRADLTHTAIVGAVATGPAAPIGGHHRQVSFLPDGASNVFAPGWDTSQSFDGIGQFLTSSGLGSPFPEDAKLCAALASFWPAVAPDNGRTFGNEGFDNQLPMLDEELGFHPNHERVKAGQVTSFRGWDGEFGPFFEKVGTKTFVNFVPIERSDYVSQALAGRIRVDLTAEVQSADLIARNQALEQCEQVLNVGPGADTCLVVVRKVSDWATFGRGDPQLAGGGFLMEFAEFTGARTTTNELGRARRQVKKRHVCQVGTNGVAYKDGTAPFDFIPS